MILQIAFGMQNQFEARRAVLEQVANEWREDTSAWLRHDAPKLLIILIVAAVLVRLLGIITRRLEIYSQYQPLPSGLRAQQLRTLASIINSVGTFVLYFLAAMQALPLFGVDIKPILASAGIVGLAVGFGAQTLVKDVINGFFILLENQFDIGDVIQIAGVTGTVEVMTLRKTALRDANGTVHVVPNSEIKVSSNMTRDWSQLALHVTADYSEPSDKITGLLREAALQIYTEP